MSDSKEAAAAAAAETVFNSVGIDVGSSTTHLTISRLVVGRRNSHFHRKPEILERRTVYRSPVMFTPFLAEGTIDHDAVLAFVQQSYREAGIDFAQVSTGAVICTGEAARRKNAQAITRSLAKDSGKFVCATAGHHFEAMLAAHGSGSVELSHHIDGLAVNLDIGGGTTKRTLIRDGAIENTAAINVGARLIVLTPDGVVTRAEPAGLTIARSLGIDAAPGRSLSLDQQHALAAAMAQLIVAFLGLATMPPLARELLVTEPPAPLPDRLIMTEPPRCVPKPFRLVCSGGVSEFIYGRAELDPGDLGPLLGRALRQEFRQRIPEDWVASPREGIRATVIGACEFTLQVSGDTVYASDASVVPVSNVPVISVPIDWSHVTADDTAAATRKALAAADQNDFCALFYGGPQQFGYGRLVELARGIAAGCSGPATGTAGQPKWVFVFSHNIANTLGRELSRHLPDGTPFLCLDEIEVGDLDYLDIGAAPAGETYLPVVVKSLVFQSAGAQIKDKSDLRNSRNNTGRPRDCGDPTPQMIERAWRMDPRFRGDDGEGRIAVVGRAPVWSISATSTRFVSAGAMGGHMESPMESPHARIGLIAVALLAALGANAAMAQTYPDKSIRIIVPVAPGGSADLVARNVAARLSDSLGKPVVIESRAGAGGEIGVEAVVRAPPDGYMLLSTPNGPISVAGHLQTLHYDVAKDLVPVAMAAFVGAGIGVNASLPIHNIAELIKASRDNPAGLSFSHSGVGNHMHLSGELLKSMTGANLVPIAYRGTSPAVTAILSGDVPFGIADLTSLMPMAEAGKVRIIAVVNSERIGAAPNVPTVAESGVAGYAADAWMGVFAPAGTPPDIVKRLNAEVGRALAQPELRETFLKAGLEPVTMTPEAMRDFVLKDIAKWGKVIKDINLKIQ